MLDRPFIHSVLFAVTLLTVPLLAAAEESTLSGTGTLSLSRVEPPPPDGERWNVLVQDGAAGTDVTGTVKIAGVPIARPGNLGKVLWNVSSGTVSGTVNAAAGHVLAWFKGQIAQGSIQGTFTAVTGQSGTWEWEGPIPKDISSAE